MKTTLDAKGFAVTDGYIHVYNADPITCEYISESDEYLTSGVGLPAYGHIAQPLPTKKGNAVIRGYMGWEYIENHRGEIVYSTESKSEMIISELGPIPKNVTTTKPSTAFDEWNGKKWVINMQSKNAAEIASAEADKASRISVANGIISPLIDAVELDMATDEEVAKLKSWKLYRVLLTRVDTSLAPSIEWPQAPHD